MTSVRAKILRIEALEERSMFAATILDNGWLSITGTKRSDAIQVSMQGSNITVNDNGVTSVFNAPQIKIHCKGGDDNVQVDDSVTVPVWISGGKGNDSLKAGAGDDIISGDSGNDTIFGSLGQDLIFGGAGDDFIDTGDGGNTVAAGAGNDTIYGGNVRDVLFGMSGDDEIYSGDGYDYCDGGSGKDRLEAATGNDQICGGAGNDLLIGGDDDDVLLGGAGADNCFGGSGDDKLKGGSGNDLLDGEGDNNLLDRDKGRDSIANGLETDLDNEAVSALRIYGMDRVLVRITLSNDHGALKTDLYAESIYYLSDGFHEIVVGGVTVGQFQTYQGIGSGRFSSNPNASQSEQPFATSLPLIRPGLKVQVDSLLLPEIRSIYSDSISLPTLPTNFS